MPSVVAAQVRSMGGFLFLLDRPSTAAHVRLRSQVRSRRRRSARAPAHQELRHQRLHRRDVLAMLPDGDSQAGNPQTQGAEEA